jgi:hypothetical protein
MLTRSTCVIWLFSILLVACGSVAPVAEETQPALQSDTVVPAVPGTADVPVQDVQLALADSDWDGVKVPAGQQCQRFGGENPSTPRIQVGDVPEGADAIILEFSDRSYPPMDDGGHGMVGFQISPGTREVVVPSIPGHTFDLPEGFFLIQEHQAPSFDTAGAYMPPCSGGRGNTYYVTVKAVTLHSLEDLSYTLLAQAILEMGKY